MMMSGSKLVPEIRFPSLAKLTLFVHLLPISLVDTLGMLAGDDVEVLVNQRELNCFFNSFYSVFYFIFLSER